MKSSHEDVTLFFAADGAEKNIFRDTMNVNRFFIRSRLRFDNRLTTDEGKKML